jgi:hypothetical protein
MTIQGLYVDDYTCGCGNTANGSGFHPCDEQGEYVEPLPEWGGQYRCADCGTRTVVQDSKVFVLQV